MTVIAGSGCRLVEEDEGSINKFLVDVAGGAGDVLVRALQRKDGLLVVKE